MANLNDAAVQGLFTKPNHAVVSTLDEDGSIRSAVVWVSADDGELAVNSAVGRRWPSNLERDPRVNVLVYDADNPFEYVEVRGQAHGTIDGADEHIDKLAKKYIDADSYPFRQEGEQRIKYVVTPDVIRHQKQG